MPRKVHPDDLRPGKRRALVGALRECIQTGRPEPEDRRWLIPNSRVGDRVLPTYGFPRNKPRLWVATTQFPRRNTTRDAFLFAVSTVEPISIAFELNIGRRPSNDLNFRFQQGTDDKVVVRCKCAFTIEGSRRRSDLFFQYVEREALELEPEYVGGRRFVNLFNLPLGAVHEDWPRFCGELEAFAQVVEAYKGAYRRGELGE